MNSMWKNMFEILSITDHTGFEIILRVESSLSFIKPLFEFLSYQGLMYVIIK